MKLGSLVRAEQTEEAQHHGRGGRRKYSQPAKSTSEALAEYDQKVAASKLN